jgi:hypothetical protein
VESHFVKQKQPRTHPFPARGQFLSQFVHGAGAGEAAETALSMLMTTGAVHATAAPAPIRFRAVRREILDGLRFSSTGPLLADIRQ